MVIGNLRLDTQTINLKIHNGRKKPLDVKQMAEFDSKSIFERFFKSQTYDASNMFELMGDWVVDFTNLHDWAKEIPDIDPKSARIFTLWAEDSNTREILGLIRGFYILLPFTLDKATIHDYYSLAEDVPYYPMAIISSFRTIITEEKLIDKLLEQIREAMGRNWKEVREETIRRVPKESKLWKRYVFSFPELIHFTIVCPSSDREIINAVNRLNYRMTGVMQIFSSPSPSYDEATIRHHLRSAQEIIDGDT
jgi:hypothetical protein